MTENILTIARRVRELGEAATAGPWVIAEDGWPVHFPEEGKGFLPYWASAIDESEGNPYKPYDISFPTLDFIAETRTAAPQLAEAVERMAAWLRECGAWGSRDAAFDARELLRELGIPLEEAGDE